MKIEKIIFGLLFATSIINISYANQINNSTVSITVPAPPGYGGGITSVKVLGNEVVDTADRGRNIQASIFLPTSLLGNVVPVHGANQLPLKCQAPNPPWLNPQESGDECGNDAYVYHLSTNGNTLNVGTQVMDWHHRGIVPGLVINAQHKVGPHSYINAQEVSELNYNIILGSDYPMNNGPLPLPLIDSVFDFNSNPTPVPFLPAAYFKANLLTKIYGLSIDGLNWTDVTSVVNTSNGEYTPSLFRYRSMAWMKDDLSWGVAFYSRQSLNQVCAVIFPMELASQTGQCPNFAAGKFGTTNNLSVVRQGLPQLNVDTTISHRTHMVVGNLSTIQHFVNEIFNSGN